MERIAVGVVAAILVGCSNAAPAPSLAPAAPLNEPSARASGVRHAVGLGKVLTSKGGQIYGYDIDENGNDGVLATVSNVETFDQDTGTIAKSFPKQAPSGTTYGFVGIAANDVGLVVRYVQPKGSLYATRFYNMMNPAAKAKFAGKWTPPVKDIQVEGMGPNQTTATTAFFAIELQNQDIPILFSSNVAKKKFGKVFELNPSGFSLGDQPQFGQDTATDQAVFATSPDGGAVGGAAPINVLVDLKTGKQIQFQGLNNGPFGAGFVNGLAVDSTTGIAATTTELNAQVEFYNLAKQTATFAQLPCTGSASQSSSAWGVANDPVNGLFLVSAPVYCSQGGAILVYDESGNLVEAITGFKFPTVGPGAAVLNPSKRMGWAQGSSVSQLQQFFY
jgi:hypothetical protein